MFCILFAQDCFVLDAPINTESVIQYTDATICLWMIKLITLVLEYCCFAQYGEAMGKAFGDEKLSVIIFC